MIEKKIKCMIILLVHVSLGKMEYSASKSQTNYMRIAYYSVACFFLL